MTEREEPGCSVYGSSEVVPFPLVTGARVDRHTNLDRRSGRPGLIQKKSLCCDSGFDGRIRLLECHAERVPDGLEDISLVAFRRLTKDPVVTLERRLHLKGMGLPEPGARL